MRYFYLNLDYSVHLFVFCEISLQLFSSFLISLVISCFTLAYPIVYYFFHNDKRQAFSTLVLHWKFSDVFLWLELGYGLFKGHLRGKVAHSSHHAKGLDYRRDSPWLALSLIAQLKYVYQSLHCEVLIPPPSYSLFFTRVVTTKNVHLTGGR